MMRELELEEGEAYLFQDDYDDDENIDPDKDFSYIDKKIENVLGHYQKDFMVGLSAESLGARFGGYGSFLPMQQRSPPMASNQRSQSHISSKSPQDLPSENPTIAINHSLPARSISASGGQTVKTISDSGTILANNGSKLHSAGEFASSHQKKKPMVPHFENKSLKFRVKMASETISSLDKSAIYSGLGLDMSPSSSPEGSPSDNDGISTGLQEMSLESPSFIVKTMMTIPLPNNDLLSPLHDSFIYLRDVESNLKVSLPGTGEALPVNIARETMCPKGKKEARKEKKSKVKDASKVKKSKYKEASEAKKLKQNFPTQKPVELMKKSPANIVTSSAARRDDDGASTADDGAFDASINLIGAYTEDIDRASLTSKSISKPSIVFDKGTEIGCLGEDIDNPMKHVRVARRKAKEEPDLAKKHDACEADIKITTLRGDTENDKKFNFMRSESTIDKKDDARWRDDEVKFSKHHNVLKDQVKEEVFDSAFPMDGNAILFMKGESNTERRNEGRRENEVKKFPKQQGLLKDNVKEEFLNPTSFIEAGVYSKENGNVSKNEENDEYNDVLQEMKHDNVETLEALKQKSCSRDMTHLPPEQGLLSQKENPSTGVKKKLKDSRRISAAELPKGSSIVRSSATKKEAVIPKNNISSNSKNGDTDLFMEMKKNNEVTNKANPRKRRKEVNSKGSVIVIPEQEVLAPTTKMKEKSSSNKFDSNIGSNMGGSASCMTEKDHVGGVPPAENAPVVIEEDWVGCDKCHKWRLLPLGMSAKSLRKKLWTCSMITWLPGMNNCSISEDETSAALRALYVPLDPALIQNNQPTYPDPNVPANVSTSAINVVSNSQPTSFDTLPSGGKRKNLVKTEISAARQSGIQHLHMPVKKDQQCSGEIRKSNNLKKHPRDLDSVRKGGDCKLSQVEKKRVADVEACGVPKKLKSVHRQSMEDYKPGALPVSKDSAKGSSKCHSVKAKDRTQSDMTSKDDEVYDGYGRKRKLKGKQQHVSLAVVPSGEGGNLVNSWDDGTNNGSEHRLEKKSKSSNFQARESSAGKEHHRTQSRDAKSNLDDVGDSSRHKGGRSDGMPLEHYHADRVSRSRKTPVLRTSSETAHDLGLSDNVTTSSSSKISCKVKAKMHEVKFSPVGSISSSPKKVSKPDLGKRTSKKSVSHSEQQLKSGAESEVNEVVPHNGGFRERKSNLSRNSGIMSVAADEDHYVKKVSSGRYSNAMNTKPKVEDGITTGKPDPTYEGALAPQQNSVVDNQIPESQNKLHFDGANSVKGQSHASKIDSEKEVSSNAHGAPEFEGGSGFTGGRVNNVNNNPLKQFVAGHVSLRQSLHAGSVSNDVEASSSRKKDIFHRAAKTALREATDLKHSANRLKVAGSGLESTGIFFQAALKFLHGASLLEPGNNESRSGELAPNEVYTSTAKLCEYCALEFERCNDMASAALAYKCMEVAYMRVVYGNDVAASRDRQELQMAVRAAPQVESPSSSASDIDNLNQAAMDTVKDGHSAMDHRSHIVSAGNRPNFMRLLDFTHDINHAMEASRRSQSAFAAAMPVFTQAGNEEGISSVKRVLDFSFHDVDGILHLVRLAMESIKS